MIPSTSVRALIISGAIANVDTIPVGETATIEAKLVKRKREKYLQTIIS